MRLHRPARLARARAGVRRAPAALAALSALPGVVRGAGSERRHLRLPGSLLEQPVLDVRTHAAAPRHGSRRRQTRPDLVGHQLRGRHRNRRRRRVRGQGDPRLLSRVLLDRSLLREGQGVRRLGEPRHLGVPPRPHGRGDRADAEAPLGASGHRLRLLLLRRELLLAAARPARGGAPFPPDDGSLSALGDPGGLAARRDRGGRAARRGRLSALGDDPASRRGAAALVARSARSRFASRMESWGRERASSPSSRRTAAPPC